MIVVRSGPGPLDQHVELGAHRLVADEPAPAGQDLGPAPHELLLAALGACASMTVQMVARRRGWPLEAVVVRVDGAKDGAVYRITQQVELRGPLTESQREDLRVIATKCPVHRTLTGEVAIATTLTDG